MFLYKLEKIVKDSTFDLVKTLECGQSFHYKKLSNDEYVVYGLNSICIFV